MIGWWRPRPAAVRYLRIGDWLARVNVRGWWRDPSRFRRFGRQHDVIEAIPPRYALRHWCLGPLRVFRFFEPAEWPTREYNPQEDCFYALVNGAWVRE